MSGIIYVCGFYGAGKTTLIRAALKKLPTLNYLTTYVTRPPRPGEELHKQGEYIFVTAEDYEQKRRASLDWDHTEIGGYFYGADAAEVNARVTNGESFILAATSDVKLLREMQQRYVGLRFVIWIDTDLELANTRVIQRDGEERARKKLQDPTQSLKTAERVRTIANLVFTPTGNLVDDEGRFEQELRKILTNWQRAA